MSDNAEAVKFYNEGIGHYNNDKYDEAIERLTKAIKIDKNYAHAYCYRGMTYDSKGEYDEAIKDYDEAIRLKPDNASYNNNRGAAYYGKGEYDEAIKNYDEAIKLNPNDAVYHNNRGNTYRRKGEYDEAIENCNEAIRLNSSYANAYNNRGKAYYNKEEYDEAIKNYDYALNIDSNDSNAYNHKIIAQNAKTRKIAEDVALQYKKELDDLKKDLDIDEFKNDATAHLDDIEIKHDAINIAHKDITKKVLDADNHKLAVYYQTKADKLKRQLSGEEYEKKTKNKLKTKKRKGYIQWFWILLYGTVIIFLGIGVLLIFKRFEKWTDLASYSVTVTPALILSVWGVRYFNRRIHETVHLIEEYENKAIILMSFESYSERLKVLGGSDQAALLKYTEKVSHIITESPTYALHRKKTDKIPIELLQFMNYQNKTVPEKS